MLWFVPVVQHTSLHAKCFPDAIKHFVLALVLVLVRVLVFYISVAASVAVVVLVSGYAASASVP